MQHHDEETDQIEVLRDKLTTLAFSFGPPMDAEILQWMEENSDAEKNVLERKLTELG